MVTASADNHLVDVSKQKEEVNDFRHRILKLRWIGQQDEAERLLRAQLRTHDSKLVCLRTAVTTSESDLVRGPRPAVI
jgi:hypothetical protein